MASPFEGPQSWKEKVISADRIWNQVRAALKDRGLELPQTPRRPDVRLILNNISGMDKVFRNPGDHANSKAELVPASGDKTAAMVMINGDSLTEQHDNAHRLFKTFDLGTEGLSDAFVRALKKDCGFGLVDEAYGPAPYAGQVDKLVRVSWQDEDGKITTIDPVKGIAGSFGARAATDESVFVIDFDLFVKGTGTTAELIEGPHMAVAISQDWQTGAESTRPIVPSVAATYYGGHFEHVPVVHVTPQGYVRSIDLKNGTVVNLAPPKRYAAGPKNMFGG